MKASNIIKFKPGFAHANRRSPQEKSMYPTKNWLRRDNSLNLCETINAYWQVTAGKDAKARVEMANFNLESRNVYQIRSTTVNGLPTS